MSQAYKGFAMIVIDKPCQHLKFFKHADVTSSGIILDSNTLSQAWGMSSDDRGTLHESRFDAMFHMVLKLKQSEQDSKQ